MTETISERRHNPQTPFIVYVTGAINYGDFVINASDVMYLIRDKVCYLVIFNVIF